MSRDAAQPVPTQAAAHPPAAAARSTKPPELEDWLNARIYHRLSSKLAVLLEPTPVTPNMVSVGGGLLVVVAGYFYVWVGGVAGIALGFLCHLLWHVLDGADGDLARRTGKASPWGELIDGACDYVSHFLLYCMLGIGLLTETIGLWAYPVGIAAGFSRIAQSNHAESARRTYLWRVYGIPWLKQAQPAPEERTERTGLAARLGAAVSKAYVAAASDPVAAKVDALMETAPEPSRLLCKSLSRTPLRAQTILGPNLRTIALGLSMAMGSPLWFFLLEVVPFNVLLLWSKRLQRRCDRELLAGLESWKVAGSVAS